LKPWSIRPLTAPATAPQATAPATAPTPPVAAPRTASQPMNTAVETTNVAIAAAWFFTYLTPVWASLAASWFSWATWCAYSAALRLISALIARYLRS
jgi:hypothetical protein